MAAVLAATGITGITTVRASASAPGSDIAAAPQAVSIPNDIYYQRQCQSVRMMVKRIINEEL